MSNAKEVLQAEIEMLAQQIKARKRALIALEVADLPVGVNRRFFGVRPLIAMRTVFQEIGPRIPREEMERILMEGGIAIGRKRGYHNVRISIDLCLLNGALRMEDGYLMDNHAADAKIAPHP